MMEGLRSWLLSGLTAGVVCALAQTLMPAGPVRMVGRLVCGLVLVCVILSPLTGLDLAAGECWLEDYFAGLENREKELDQEAARSIRPIIEARFAAYIVDKAAQEGVECSVQVTCREENGTYLPYSAAADGVTGDSSALLAAWLEEDLGIPPERQRMNEGEKSHD